MTKRKTRLYVLSVLRNRKILSPLCLFCKVRLELVALVHSILIKKMIKKLGIFSTADCFTCGEIWDQYGGKTIVFIHWDWLENLEPIKEVLVLIYFLIEVVDRLHYQIFK